MKWRVLLGFLGAVSAQPEADLNLPSFELQRGEQPITVQQTATDAEGGIAITRGGSDCRKGQNISFYYAPDPKRVETRVDNTLIRSSAVLRTQPKEGGAEAQDKAVLDFFGGSLGVNDDGCPRDIKRDKQQRVVVTEGRTTVDGATLIIRNATGIGEMTGPVALSRRAEGDSPALTASSSRLSINIDDDTQTLRGNVKVEADGRISEADVLEMDEEAGFAILRGNPARSRDEDGEVAGQVIEYDLNSNDVVVRGGVEATFELDTGGDAPTLDLGGATDDGTDDTGGTEEDVEDDPGSDGPLPGEGEDDSGA